MVAARAGWLIMPLVPYPLGAGRQTSSATRSRLRIDQKSAMSLGGALAAPMTAYSYDWNLLPIGQRCG